MDQEILSLGKNARHLGIELNDSQLAQFAVYKNELLQWNAKTNLISENSSQEIITRHFLDSLTAAKFITNQNARIVDIGCGAGFPGLPLKIALLGPDSAGRISLKPLIAVIAICSSSSCLDKTISCKFLIITFPAF